MAHTFLSSNEKSYFQPVASDQETRYKNLNLNQNHQCSAEDLVSSKSVSSFGHKKYGYDSGYEDVQRISQNKQRWKRNGVSTISIEGFASNKADKQQSLMNGDKLSTDNKNTVSLHIASYENSVNLQNGPTEGCKVTKAMSHLSLKSVMFPVMVSPFEFPRQKEDGPPEPAVMQYRASQKLLEPNSDPTINISSGDDTSLADSLPTVAQNVPEAASPTLFKFTAGRFERLNDGSNQKLTFVFGEDVVFEGDGELDPVAFEFDGDQLFACYVDEDAPDELVRGLKLAESLEVLGDTNTKGPYNQIRYLLNRSNNDRIDSPNAQQLFHFLVEYHVETEKGENVVQKAAAVPRKLRGAKAKSMSNATFQQERMKTVKNKIIGLATSLPVPEVMSLAVDLLVPDSCIRNTSEVGANEIFDQMEMGTWKAENNVPLAVNRIYGQYFVFKGLKRLKALKKLRSVGSDHQMEYFKCHIYDGINFSQKLLIANPTTVSHGAPTVLQKLKLLRVVVETLGITLPKGKVLEETYFEIMDLLFHKDYPSILTRLIEFPSSYLDQLCNLKCGETPLEEIRLESGFWGTFVNSYKKNPSEALEALKQLESKTPKDVEKLLKNVPHDLLFFLSERGPHTFQSEEEAITFFTDDPHCTKKTLMKIIDKNKAREIGRYDWEDVKIKLLLKDELVYPNTVFFDQISGANISDKDFILIQNPTIPHLQLVESFGKNAVIMLMGNYGEPAPELPNSSPTAVIKILMENPLFIGRIASSLSDPVISVSIYLPGAPAGDQTQKTRFLTNVAMQMKCCLAATMTLENSHEIMNLAEEKSKAALCYVTEKVAKHFLSKCEDFEEVTVVGDASLKEIVHSVISPPPKKRKISRDNKDGSKDDGKESRGDKDGSEPERKESKSRSDIDETRSKGRGEGKKGSSKKHGSVSPSD